MVLSLCISDFVFETVVSEMSLELLCALFPLLDRSVIEEHLEQALPLGDIIGGALYWQLSELEQHQMRGQPEAAAAAHVEPSYVEDVCVVCMDKVINRC